MKAVLLLVLSMVAAAREATAQEDAKCVRERAAMVETIRAYARSDAGALGQQGLSERVLEAIDRTQCIELVHNEPEPAIPLATLHCFEDREPQPRRGLGSVLLVKREGKDPVPLEVEGSLAPMALDASETFGNVMVFRDVGDRFGRVVLERCGLHRPSEKPTSGVKALKTSKPKWHD